MKSVFPRVVVFSIFCAANVQAAVSYVPIDDTNVIVTGVRSDSSTSDSVVLTANYNTSYAGLYEGSLAGAATAPSSSWHALLPATISSQSVSAATFYGPNTSLYNPAIGAGNVVAVGSFKITGSSADHAMIYEGPLDGSGTWKQIDPTTLVPNGETLLNALAHSTMGDIVVGNYDTSLITGNAFIYNRVTDMYTELNPGNTYASTAYGVWQNGGPTSTHYTIAGGQGPNPGTLDKSYLVDYDSSNGNLTHYRTFNYNNTVSGALVSHFDGITATSTGYNLTGFVTTGGTVKGFLASVARKPDGSFADPTWTDVFYPGGDITTGNTVVENNVLGIFLNGGTQSYLATVTPDQYGVAIGVAKSGSRATFTITNTGNIADSFDLSRTIKVANSYTGPSPSKPGKSPLKFTYSLGGANITKALEAGTAATGSIAPGASAQLVEKVKVRSKLAFKRTIHTTVKAVSEADSSASASAKVKLVLKPE
jgi:hypothetical protein